MGASFSFVLEEKQLWKAGAFGWLLTFRKQKQFQKQNAMNLVIETLEEAVRPVRPIVVQPAPLSLFYCPPTPRALKYQI